MKGLQHIQKVLARLYTDEALRKRTIENPEQLANELKVDQDWLLDLIEKNDWGMNEFTQILQNKRWKMVSGLLPLASNFIGQKKIHSAFARYSSNQPNPDPVRHFADLMAWIKWLKEKKEMDDAGRWLIQWEANLRQKENSGERWTLHLFPKAFKSLLKEGSGKPGKENGRLRCLSLRQGNRWQHYFLF